jgi:hypothetical protein
MIIFENERSEQVLAQPTFAKLAQEGAYLDGFYAVAHPSQPNYIAMVTGDTYGVKNDSNHDIDARSIADLLEDKGLTWKSYAEGYPGDCFTGASSGQYRRKHEPFISLKNIQSNPARCANIVPATQLAKDIAAGDLPDFMYYVPDMRNDGHDTNMAYADKYLNGFLVPLLGNPAFMRDTLVVVTFDEDDGGAGNHIYAALLGDSVKPGAKAGYPYNFYSLLRTIEDTLGLDSLHKKDEAAPLIGGVWK